MSGRTDHLLFLTATPHKGDPENFRLFLDLLEPGFFATNEMVQESIKNKDNPLFIRRMKEDLKNFDGEPLFLPRHVQTISFNFGTDSPDEKELYNQLSKYVNEQYNKALTKDKKRNVAFALVILQRRLASSTYALLQSLKRRKKRLEDLLTKAEERKKPSQASFDYETIEDLSEEERWEQEEIWETLSVAENREELQEEIKTIDSLIERAKDIISREKEIKVRQLKKSLRELSEKFPEREDKKILVFTESRDTLSYLEKKVKDWGYKINTIHGGMRMEERIKAEAIFKNETDVLVATEAAGEGINLQFCHLMLNYDIPWNPNRLEQRMGRIHRYGQRKEVYVFNLVATDTREGKVLTRLFTKLEEIRQALGSDKVFDVVSEILHGRNLSQLLMEAAANARNIDEILKEVDVTVDQKYIAQVKEDLGESLATHYIDYTLIKEMAQRAREHRLIPEYTESYFKKAFVKAGGKLRERRDGFLAVDSVPYDIRKIADEDTFKRSHGPSLRRYPRITFDKEIAFENPNVEFVSFGHPLFEGVMVWVEKSFASSVLNGATFVDPDGKLEGHILFYEGEIADGMGGIAGKRLFAFHTRNGEIAPVSPSVIWDLAESKAVGAETVNVETLKQLVSSAVISKLETYKTELLEERTRQAEIKQKYGKRSLEYLIVKLDGELIALYERKERGENVDLAIRNKEERKTEYEKALEELKDQIQKETSLTMTMPRFVGIIRVKPLVADGQEIESDPEVEEIAMRVAMDYERANGRVPQDVSAEDLGFDIRSTDPEQKIRYIEVKGRAGEGFVQLTTNEWFKAQRFKDDYYLYAVMNTSTDPQLYVIQNPAKNLQAKERIDVRYQIELKQILEKGEKEVG